MFVIEEELKKLPDQPGVYIMHDSRDADHLHWQGDQSAQAGAPVFSAKP